jgi:uncharacterized protein
MVSNMEKKYIDANVFVQGILREDKRYKEVILKAANNEFIGVTSVLSWDEIVYIVKKFLGKEIANREGKKFFSLPNIIFADAKKDIVMKAQELVEKYGLNPRDAIHAATAISYDINEIISEDEDFDCIKELKREDPTIFSK